MRFLGAIFVFLMGLYNGAGHAEDDILVLRAIYQNSEPKYFLGGKDKGLCGDIYERLNQRLKQYHIHIKIPDTVLPIKRVLSELENAQADIFCGAARNKERAARFNFSKTPVYNVSYVVVARKDDPYIPTSFQDLANTQDRVGAFWGTVSASFLKSHQGVRVSDQHVNLWAGVENVINGQLRYFYYHDLGLYYLLKEKQLTQLRVLPTKFITLPQWMLYGKHLSSGVREILDREIRDMAYTGEIDFLWSKYKP